jgi:sugar lactone lactonase YvrE
MVQSSARRNACSVALATLLLCSAALAASAAGDRNRIRPASAAVGSIETVAGGFLGDGGPALAGALAEPWDVAVDAAGNTFVADRDNHRIRKVGTDGVITTFAGSGLTAFSGDGGPASQAGLNQPSAIAFDAAGNLYVAEAGGDRVRRITPAGVITTVAGTGVAASTGDGGPATAAQLNTPEGIAVDAAGNIYVSEFLGHRVRKFTVGGTIQTIAGTGVAAFSGDGGAGTSATLNRPIGLAVNAGGDVFIADSFNNRIRKLSAGGTITTVAGSGGTSCSGGGSALSTSVFFPTGVELAASGELFISSCSIFMLRADNYLQRMAGDPLDFGYQGDGMLAVDARINTPAGMAFDAAGNLLFADSSDQRVRRVELSMPGSITISSLAGKLVSTQGDPGLGSSLGLAADVASAGPAGGLLIADRGTNRIRLLKPDGTLVDFAGNGFLGYSGEGEGGPATQAMLAGPTGVAVGPNGGPVFVADRQASRVRMINNGLMSTVLGAGTSTSENVPASNSSGTGVVAVAVDPYGSVYVVQRSKIRRFVPGGNITTVAGTGTAGYNGDNQGALTATLSSPQGIAVDATGVLYLADTNNHRVRKVVNGVITTIAGNGIAGLSGDGGPATAANLNSPRDIAVDSAGTVYVSDGGNGRIRRIATDGTITSIAGSGTYGFNGDTAASGQVKFSLPWGLTLGADNALYVADHSNMRVRRIPLDAPASAPLAPRMDGAIAGDAQATVRFSPPTSNGGSPVTGYTVASLPAGGVDQQAGSTALAHTVAGLANGVSYTFTVRATNAIGTSATSSPSTAVVPLPQSISIADAAFAEGNAGSKLVAFTVTLSGPSASPVTFGIATEPGTALPDSDFTMATTGGFSIPAGQTQATVQVAVAGDTVVEANETFTVNLLDVVGAAVAKGQARATIDNDDLPALSIDDASIGEGDAGQRTISFTVRLSSPTSAPVTVDIGTANGSAVAGSDYVARALPGRVIDAGRDRVQFDVIVNGDAVHEGNETFSVILANAVGASVADGAAIGTIVDDDAAALVGIAAIQGAGAVSPLLGETVGTEGVVTARLADGAVIQSTHGDGDPATSEGLFVRTAEPLQRGDYVRATGVVVELDASSPGARGGGETWLAARALAVLAHGLALPAPVTLDAAVAGPGVAETLERVEGMRVHAPALRIVAPTDGDPALRAGGRKGVSFAVVAGAPRPFLAPAVRADRHPERLLVDARAQRGATPLDVDAGDTVRALTGVLGEAEGAWRLLPDPGPIAVDSGARPTMLPPAPTGWSAIAGLHVDLPALGDARAPVALAKAAHQVCATMGAPAAVALLEPASGEALDALAAATNARVGNALFPHACPADLQYVPVARRGNATARGLGLLVDTTPIAPNRARAEVLSASAELAGEAFTRPDGSRVRLHDEPPLLATLRFNAPGGGSLDTRLLVVRLTPLDRDADADAAAGHGWRNRGEAIGAQRLAQARSIQRLVRTLAATPGPAHLVLVGDFDAPEFDDGRGDLPGLVASASGERATRRALAAGPALLDNLLEGLPAGERYTVVRDGIAQARDHVLVTPTLVGAPHQARLRIARANADFAEDNRADGGVPLRVSDHDPVVLYLALPDPPR